MLVLLCAIVQGTWAQDEWATVYKQTQTTAANWTALDAGSTTGKTLGSANATTYYYATSDLSFTNTTAGGSGLTIQGTVYLYVPEGMTVTCTGANASGQTGAGAGIELTLGNSLYLIGGGTLNATGGKAANGGNGGNGVDSGGTWDESTSTGSGGSGGYGGGGAGAGIGTHGGNGGGRGTASVSGTAHAVAAGWPTEGLGTEGAPFIISNTDDWNTFANFVNGGYAFSGNFVRLGDDISVSTMAGTSDANSFQGTFDGDGHTLTFTKGTSAEPFAEEYCAPFRHVKNAVIKNLHVAGTIYTNQKKAAGFVGESHGALTLTGCRSSIAINSSTVTGDDNHDGTHGGFVGTLSGSGNTITIDGCVFDGSFATTNGTINCGGFIGWPVYNTPTIKNSLMIPSSVDEGMLNKTFTRVYSTNEPTITNCYYVATTNLPTDQGTAAYTAATTPANLGSLVEDYGMVKAYANGILVGGTYYVAPATVILADNADNSTAISGADGYVANVTLAARTLYKDGAWNTICLPFDVTIAGSPLAGATARPLTSASISGSTLTLTFGDAVTTLEAGTPYIIKWASGTDLTAANLVFNGVTIDAAQHDYDNRQNGDQRVRFLGTYASQSFTDEDKSILLMGGENTLYYPTAGAGIGAQRAYFKIGGDGALLARRLTSFNIDFGDDEATGIISTTNYTNDTNSDAWFTLDGRRLSAKPLRAGVYINNGIKVVIK